MTITVTWWMVVLVLFFAPTVYSIFRRPGGDYDFQLDVLFILLACWCTALGMTIMKAVQYFSG